MLVLCRAIVFLGVCLFLLNSSLCGEAKEGDAEKEDKYARIKKKNVRDYTDADIEMLADQWDEDEEPLEADELPEWKRPPPKIDPTKIDPNNPESILAMSKKGKTLMMFVSVSGNPSRKEAEDLTQLWQGMLFNAHIEVQRFMVEDSRAIFMLQDGSKSYEVKDFLIKQDRCTSVTIEGKVYQGKGSDGDENPEKSTETKKTEL